MVSQTLSPESSYNPAIPLLDINPKELKVGIESDMHTPILIEALFAIVKRWKQLIYATTDE